MANMIRGRFIIKINRLSFKLRMFILWISERMIVKALDSFKDPEKIQEGEMMLRDIDATRGILLTNK